MNEMENHRGCVSPSTTGSMSIQAWVGIVLLGILALAPLMIAEHQAKPVPLKTREELRKDLDQIYFPVMPKKGKP